jgi:hypothetical protein
MDGQTQTKGTQCPEYNYLTSLYSECMRKGNLLIILFSLGELEEVGVTLLDCSVG